MFSTQQYISPMKGLDVAAALAFLSSLGRGSIQHRLTVARPEELTILLHGPEPFLQCGWGK